MVATGGQQAAEPAGPVQQPPNLFDALRLMPASIWLPLIATSVLALGAFFYNDRSVVRLSEQDHDARQLMTVEQRLVDLRATLIDAEAGQRGYLLTGEDPYLEPYGRALAALPVIGADLRRAVGDDLELQAALAAIEMLQTRKLGELEATLGLARQGNRRAATALLGTDEGQRLSEALRVAIADAQEVIDRRIALMQASQTLKLERARLASVGMGLLTLLLVALLVRMLVREAVRQERMRHAAESQRAHLEQQVAERTAELSDLTTHLQTAIENEKQSLAQNLHDELGGLLTAARMDLSWLQGRAADADAGFRGKLDELADTLGQAMNLKRRVVEDLRPALLEHFGLATALSSYFDETCRKAGLECRASIPEDFERVPPELAVALFRIGQESLTNVIRHAKAKRVDISLSVDGNDYLVHIADDGAGMDLARVRGSHGIAGMRHRIASLGGRFELDSRPGAGTRLTIRVPRATPRSAA